MIPFSKIFVEGHRETAGGLHAVDIGDDDLACGRMQLAEQGGQQWPFGVIRQYCVAAAIEAKDIGRAVEGTEHKSDAAVL